MTSFTKYQKDTVVSKLLVAGFTPKIEALMEENKALANEIWEARYKNIKPHIEAINELEPSVLDTMSCLTFMNSFGHYREIEFNGETHITGGFYNENRKLFKGIADVIVYRPWGDRFETNAFDTKYDAIQDKVKELKELITTTKAELNAQFKSIRTVEKLLEQCPELKDLLPELKPAMAVLKVNSSQIKDILARGKNASA